MWNKKHKQRKIFDVLDARNLPLVESIFDFKKAVVLTDRSLCF